VQSDSVESGGGGEDSGGGGSESLGSGESTEALGGNWGRWSSQGGEAGEVIRPGTFIECDLEVLLSIPSSSTFSNGCLNLGTGVTEGPEGDNGDHWDGVGISSSSCSCSCNRCTSVAVCGITDLSSGVGGCRGGAHPFVVPDLTEGKFVAISGVTDGSEGFTPSISESEGLGGE